MVELMRVEGVTLSRRGQEVIKNLSFTVGVGKAIGLVGPNGCGKTTLLDGICGLVPLSSGCVRLPVREQMKDVNAWSFERRTEAGLRRTFQKPPRLPSRGAGELYFGLQFVSQPSRSLLTKLRLKVNRGAAEGETEDSFDSLAREVLSFPTSAERLSFGQTKAACLSLALRSSGRVLLLDEPFEGLAERLKAIALASIGRFLAKGGCAVIADHDVKTLSAVCSKLIWLNGRLNECGSDK